MDWKQEVLKRLDALADKLGTTAGYLWQILVRQAIATGIADAFVAVVFAILAIICGVLAKKCFKKHDMDFTFGGAWLCVGAAVSLLLFGLNTHDAILELVNPQYYALHEVLQTLVGK